MRAKSKHKDYAKLVSQFESSTRNKSSNKDDRLWKMTEDKAENASAIIRFLPYGGDDDLNWAKILSYGFHNANKTKYYIHNSPRTFDEPDPVYELNGKLMDIGTPEATAKRNNQKLTTSYYSNILVISDPLAPHNEGKIFLFKYGTRIFEMLQAVLVGDPLFPTADKIDAFDPFIGANFRLRRYKASSGFASYDKSSFESPSEMCNGDDDKIEALLKSVYSIPDLLDRKNFESYEELSRHLARFYATATDAPSANSLSEKVASLPPKTFSVKESPKVEAINEDDDYMNFFNDILNET